MCDFRALSIVDVGIVRYYHEIGVELRIMNFYLQFSLASVSLFYFCLIVHLSNLTSHFEEMMNLVLFIEKEILYVLLILFLRFYF